MAWAKVATVLVVKSCPNLMMEQGNEWANQVCPEMKVIFVIIHEDICRLWAKQHPAPTFLLLKYQSPLCWKSLGQAIGQEVLQDRLFLTPLLINEARSFHPYL